MKTISSRCTKPMFDKIKLFIKNQPGLNIYDLNLHKREIVRALMDVTPNNDIDVQLTETIKLKFYMVPNTVSTELLMMKTMVLFGDGWYMTTYVKAL